MGTKKPNGRGIHDMSGNVWEWVSDRYAADYYGRSTRLNSQGPAKGHDRVLRGGCWFTDAAYLRTTVRLSNPPDFRDFDIGFRVLLTAEKEGRKDAFVPYSH